MKHIPWMSECVCVCVVCVCVCVVCVCVCVCVFKGQESHVCAPRVEMED